MKQDNGIEKHIFKNQNWAAVGDSLSGRLIIFFQDLCKIMQVRCLNLAGGGCPMLPNTGSLLHQPCTPDLSNKVHSFLMTSNISYKTIYAAAYDAYTTLNIEQLYIEVAGKRVLLDATDIIQRMQKEIVDLTSFGHQLFLI